MSVNEDYVWNGGPEPTNLTEGTKSLGALCLKRLKEQGDAVKLVCHYNFFLYSSKTDVFYPSDRWFNIRGSEC